MRHCRPCSLAWVLGLLVFGCSGDDAARDAGIEIPDAPRSDTGSVPSPTAPAPTVLAELTPCPDGWREQPARSADSVITCEPWPAGEVPVCTGGLGLFPGESGCVVVSRPCPAGDWPDDLPASTIYVLAGATTGGEGTRASPFATITEALAVASPGDTVAVSKGTFAEEVEVGEGVTLRGACAEETVMDGPVAGAVATILLVGDGATVEDLRVEGGWHGLQVLGAHSVALRGVVISNAQVFGLAASGGAHMVADSVVVRGTRPADDDSLGVGVFVLGGASLELHRGSIENNTTWGVAVGESASTAQLSDIAIRGTVAQPSDLTNGQGLLATHGGHVSATRAVVEMNMSAGVFSNEPGAEVVLTDAVIRDNLTEEVRRTSGFGIVAQGGGLFSASRVLIERNETAGVMVGTYGTMLDLEDSVVRDTRPQPADSLAGFGVAVIAAGTATLARVVLDANLNSALLVDGEDSAATVSDIVVLDTAPVSTLGFGGRALTVQEGGRLDATRGLLLRNMETGILVDGTATGATLSDLVIRGTRGRPTDDATGRGVTVQGGAQVEVVRSLIEANREAGVLAASEGTVVTLTDVVVRGTLPRDCAETGCAGLAAGSGVVTLRGADVRLDRFLLSGNALCGLQIAGDGLACAHDGEIAGNAIGVNLQNSSIAIDCVSRNILFRDNGVNLDSTALPVPEP